MSYVFRLKHFLSHTANISSLSTSCLSPKHTRSMQTTQAPQITTKTNCSDPSTKHNKLFQPITDKKSLGVGFGCQCVYI